MLQPLVYYRNGYSCPSQCSLSCSYHRQAAWCECVQTRVAINQRSQLKAVYELRNDADATIQRKFGELEMLYDCIKDLLPTGFDRPPKKKLLLSDIKLVEKRRAWAEVFVGDLIANYADKSALHEGQCIN